MSTKLYTASSDIQTTDFKSPASIPCDSYGSYTPPPDVLQELPVPGNIWNIKIARLAHGPLVSPVNGALRELSRVGSSLGAFNQGEVVVQHDFSIPQWNGKNESTITAPYAYLMSRPGKSFRTQLLRAVNVWLEVDERSFCIIDRTISVLHNASLLVDDIQDDSKFRRGVPVAHEIYGIAQTINAANYMYFLAQQELRALPAWPDLCQIYNEELLNLHRGQGMELFWRDTLSIPTEKDYLQMVSNKTGGLFRLAVRMLQRLSPKTHDLVPLADLLGLIYQIRDDYKNLCSDEMTNTKGFCEDLTEGKFSFPIIHALQTKAPGSQELLSILKCRTSDDGLKSRAVALMANETHSFGYTRTILTQLSEMAQKEVSALETPNLAMQAVLAKLSQL